MASSSSRPAGGSSNRKSSSALPSSNYQVKCRFCGNTFTFGPNSLSCPKCGRRANRSLDTPWRVASVLIPLVGLVYAFVIRSHSPMASNQGFIASTAGLALYGVAFALLHFATHTI